MYVNPGERGAGGLGVDTEVEARDKGACRGRIDGERGAGRSSSTRVMGGQCHSVHIFL